MFVLTDNPIQVAVTYQSIEKMTEEKRGLASFFKADVSDLMKGAGKVLRTDLGDLLRTPGAANANAPASTAASADTLGENTATEHVTRTNSRNRPPPVAENSKSIFAAKRLQTAEEKLAALGEDEGASQRVRVNTQQVQARNTALDDRTLIRITRKAPTGNAADTLMPAQVNEFSRDPTQPQGNIAHDPAHASYTCHYGNVQLLVEITWSSGEARDCLAHLTKEIGAAAVSNTEQHWALGSLNDSLVFAWCRENYYFRATSAGGGNVLVPFLTDFPY
jgi:hypothetical protein